MISVSVASPQELVVLDYQRLKDCARAVLAGEQIKEAKIVLAFVDDTTIAALNKRFLEHEGPTDVITFQHGEISGGLVDEADGLPGEEPRPGREFAVHGGHEVEKRLGREKELKRRFFEEQHRVCHGHHQPLGR